MATLYSYFTSSAKCLPNPSGPLSAEVPSSSIKSANKIVGPLLQSADPATCKKRGQYDVFTPEEKASIAKVAAESGVTRAIRNLGKKFPGRALRESTVRTWVKQYKSELSLKSKTAEDSRAVKVLKLENKTRGRPLLIGKELDDQVKVYISALRKNGAVINSAIVMGCAEGIVKNHDSNLLHGNGGHIKFTKYWAQNLLSRMGYVKRRASTKAKVSSTDFEERKAQFIFDIKALAEFEDIPESLIINWDHTGINYVPVSNWTMAREGSKRVDIIGVDDKRQITAVLAGTMDGHFLPPQIIYKGKTKKCLPSVEFPENWDVTYTQNHWANEKTTEDYIKKILMPYIKEKRITFGDEKAALVIFDRFRGQCTPHILSLLESNNIHIAVVPANCTDRLQPLDVSVNKAVKEFLRRQFHLWYSDQICSDLKEERPQKIIDLKMSIVKPLGAKWLIEMYDYMKIGSEIIVNGFRGSGIHQ